MFFELNLRSKELIFCCSYNPHKSLIREPLKELIKPREFYFKTYDNLTLIGNLSNLFSSIPKHMTVLHWSGNLSKLYSSISKHMTILPWPETSQSYLVLFLNIWQSYVDRKLIKAIQVYSKTYDNLTLIGNLIKLFRSIPKNMTVLGWLGNL